MLDDCHDIKCLIVGTTDGRKYESEEYILSRHDIHTPSLTPQTTPPQVTPVAFTGAVSEQAQVPDLPPREKRITPRVSPQPWGDPNSPTREVNRSYELDGRDRREANTWYGFHSCHLIQLLCIWAL